MRSRFLSPLITIAICAVMIMVNNAQAYPLADQATPPDGSLAPGVTITPLLQYQGRMTNPTTGQPVADGVYAATFSLYNIPSGGAAVWTETKNVPVAGGLFSTALGDTAPLPQSLFSGQALWLGIKVGTDLEATPRQAIMPVAYALSLVPGAAIAGSSASPALSVSNSGGPALVTTGPSTLGGNVTINGSLTGGTHAHSGADIISGIVAEPRIEAALARDAEVAASYYNMPTADNRFVNVTGPEVMSANSSVAGLAVQQSGGGPGVFGSNSGAGAGLSGYSTNANGVYGEGASSSGGSGLYGTSPFVAVWGQATGTTGRWGGYFNSDAPTGIGVMGVAADTTGTNYGVYGTTYSPNGYAGYFNGNVKVNGTIETSRVTYSTPRVQYFTIGSSGFVPASNVDYFNAYGNGGAYIVSGSGALVAPVHLPHGAVVTEFRVYFYDASAGDLDVWLALEGFSGGYSILGELTTAGTPGYSNLIDTTIASSTINNTVDSYLIYAYSPAWDSNLRIKAAVVVYTVNEVP